MVMDIILIYPNQEDRLRLISLTITFGFFLLNCLIFTFNKYFTLFIYVFRFGVSVFELRFIHLLFFLCSFIIGEVLIGFQDVAFFPSCSFSTTFLKNCSRG